MESKPAAISREAQSIIRNAKHIYVSAISVYEIGQKAAKGNLSLPVPINDWFFTAQNDHDLEELPITAEICAAATLLEQIHNDPFDRLLIATAIEHDLTLVTPDPLIRKYPSVKLAW
jgi:PIN domain nuclease of toxin-antitoxin system